MPSRSFDSSWPAAPTNGTPCLSSWKPGASPTNIRSASGAPAPKTTCVRPCESAHFVQSATASRYARSSAAATGSSATAATKAGLSGGAVRCERRAELLRHLGLAAVGAGGIGVGHPHQFLEVAFAAHADVLVD